MKNEFEQGSILYFPTIEIQDETFLKTALIFWDTVYRIVPESVVPNDSIEVKKAVDAGLLQNISLNNKDLEKTAEKFDKFYSKLSKTHFIPAGFETNNLAINIHPEKIDEKLRPFFQKIAMDISPRGYYKVSEAVGTGYMFYLSETVANRRNIPKLTDSPDIFAGITYFDAKGNFGETIIDDNALDAYTNLIIETLIPQDIRSLKIEKIINLNEKYKGEKKRFRNLISNFTGKIAKIEDIDFARTEVESFKNSLVENQATVFEILRGFFGELKCSALYVGFPTFISNFIGNIFASPSDFYSVGKLTTGASISGVASIIQAGRETRRNWKSSTSNYYMDLLKDLDSNEPIKLKSGYIRARLNEFVND